MIIVAVALIAGSVFAFKSCGNNPFAVQKLSRAGVENAAPATVERHEQSCDGDRCGLGNGSRDGASVRR